MEAIDLVSTGGVGDLKIRILMVEVAEEPHHDWPTQSTIVLSRTSASVGGMELTGQNGVQ
jgi:hypothetical protein